MFRLLRSIIIIWLSFGLLLMLAMAWGRAEDKPILSFIAVRDNMTDIFLYDIHTGLDYNLTDNIQQEWNMSWSQNPIHLGYTSTIEAGKVDDSYHIMSRLGTSTIIDITEYGSAYGTTLAPDSQSLVFFSSFPQIGSDIYLTDLSNYGTYNLTRTPEQSEILPRWSPDSQFVLFLRDGNLYLVDRQTQEPQLFLDYDLIIDDMFWSPDGQNIAFYSSIWQDGRYLLQLHTIAADGTNLQLYDLDTEPRAEPVSWSPDSCCIVLGLTSGDLAIIELETDMIQYFVGDARRFAPAWSPDGRWIAFIENRRLHLLDLHTQKVNSIDKSWRIHIPMYWKP